jgi:hypothetical protein
VEFTANIPLSFTQSTANVHAFVGPSTGILSCRKNIVSPCNNFSKGVAKYRSIFGNFENDTDASSFHDDDYEDDSELMAFGLCSSSGILNSRKHNASETGSVSVLRREVGVTYSVLPLAQ